MKTSVFQFTNYREFLKAWMCEKQGSARPMSIRQFARKAGIASPNYFQRVTESDLKLTPAMMEKFVTGLSLAVKEAEYFRALVLFNQCEEPQAKVQYLRQLEKLSSRAKVKEVKGHDMLKAWYYPVIWELASCKNMELTAENAVSALNRSISLKEAKQAIAELESSGFLMRQPGTNRFTQPDIRLQSTDEIMDLYVQVLHRKYAEISLEKLQLPVSEREYQGITISLSPERFRLAKALIKKATQEIVEQLANDSEADRVYRINFQMFPVTEALPPAPHFPHVNLKEEGVVQ